MIREIDGGYKVFSKSGKSLSKLYDNKQDAEKRLDQIEYFKNKIKEDCNKPLNEAEYKGKDVTLNKPFRTPKGPKKFAVYVKNDKGNVIIVRFGDPNMEIKRDDPERRKAYRARHKGDKIHDKTKAGYWSWKFWGNKSVSDLLKEKFNYLLKEEKYTVYHGTNIKFNDFDMEKSVDGIWFTDNIDSIKNNTTGGVGNKYIMKRVITLNNPCGWDEYDKYSIGELINMGYDGCILPEDDKTDYLVFDTKSISLNENYSNEIYYLPTNIVNKFRSQSKSNINFDLEREIEKNGIITPIVLIYHVHDKKLAISDGHNRLDIANELNIEKLPVIIKTSGSDAPINAKTISKEVNWNGKDYLNPEDLGLNNLNETESLKGGLSDNLSLKDLSIKHNVPFKEIYNEYLKGLSVEREHTDELSKIIEIVKDHLFENPKYYTELSKISLDESILPKELRGKKVIKHIIGIDREAISGKVRLEDLIVLDNAIETAKKTFSNNPKFKVSNKPIIVGVDVDNGNKLLLDGYHRYFFNGGTGLFNAYFIPMKNGDIIYFNELLNESTLNQLNSINDLKSKYNNITIDLYQNDKTKTITLSRIIVPKELRDNNIGTSFMNDLNSLADKLNYKIILTPSKDFGSNVNRLKTFYNRFGFIENKGKNKDFTHNELFYRLPT